MTIFRRMVESYAACACNRVLRKGAMRSLAMHSRVAVARHSGVERTASSTLPASRGFFALVRSRELRETNPLSPRAICKCPRLPEQGGS